ncbi:hypothetical protein [Bradyrhizobium sp. CCGUVB14]|uniref:hypothetical protein n=1 Tax=Bradyrhizobium sp. CCGUVB14 TaxID=2949628 RepID=UPI0020B31680|nr:hypothetical protein [Bradyrhizobium sp. CCGUVB14]MCP3442067.1 hypothetical protein [Bradyrhizobium sp. CCGUVB14]
MDHDVQRGLDGKAVFIPDSIDEDRFVNILKIASACLLGGMLAVTSANAAGVTEQFKFKSDSYTIQGQFKYDDTSFVVQSISGMVLATGLAAGYGGTIHSIVASPVDSDDLPFFVVDNKFDPAAGGFSFSGILFSFGTGNYGNLYFYDPVLSSFPPPFPNASPGFSAFLPNPPTSTTSGDSGPLYSPGELGTLELSTVSAVPELPIWAMLIFGFLGVATVARRGSRLRSLAS